MSDKQTKTDEIPAAKLGRKLPSEKRVTAKGVALGLIAGAIGVWIVHLAWPHVRGLFADDSPKQVVSTEEPAGIQLVDEWLVMPHRRFIQIKNPGGVTRSDGITLGFEDECSTHSNGLAKPVAVDGDRVLMRYRHSGDSFECPDGAFFFLEKDEYVGLLEHRDELRQEEERKQRELETVQRLTQPEAQPE